MGKVANAIGKTRGKDGKTSKCAEKQEKESTDGFQNNISWQLLKFMCQGWYLHK